MTKGIIETMENCLSGISTISEQVSKQVFIEANLLRQMINYCKILERDNKRLMESYHTGYMASKTDGNDLSSSEKGLGKGIEAGTAKSTAQEIIKAELARLESLLPMVNDIGEIGENNHD